MVRQQRATRKAHQKNRLGNDNTSGNNNSQNNFRRRKRKEKFINFLIRIWQTITWKPADYNKHYQKHKYN